MGIEATRASSILQRIVAAVVVGYALAVTSGVMLSYALPMPSFDAVTIGILVSFIVYVCAILWAFASRTLWPMWMGLILPTLLCGAAAWLVRPGGGG